MSDDESPWISEDGTINTETKMPSQDFQTIKSLAVSPSTSSNTPENIDETPKPSIETKFYDKLEEYYTLKQEYDQQLRDAHTMWNNSKPPMSLEKKRENYQNFMMNRKCINCGNGPGGTIFSH